MRPAPCSISIVVPVLNEAPILGAFLAQLRAVAPVAEIIVVDGGSEDDTCGIAEQMADVVIDAVRRRAIQMNAGAAKARGDVLWFLHADLSVPANSIIEIEEALADAHVVGGCFRLQFPRRELIYRVSDLLGNVGVDIFGFALGDHGIFCRRSAFERTDGYPDVPILEDAELYRKLGRLGRMVQLRDQIVCSPRAYERFGRYRTTAVYFLILALYVCGVPIRFLYRIYCRFRRQNRATSKIADFSLIKP
jgi:rSAM/selenodomain-associated transferase 2